MPRFLLGILIFKELSARRLYKSFGVKELNRHKSARFGWNGLGCWVTENVQTLLERAAVLRFTFLFNHVRIRKAVTVA
jgi:hypothetical protein